MITIDEGPNVPRVSTGVIGLDELLYGGIPRENQIMLAGDAGTGKTLLSFEILYRNAKMNIPVTFVTLEERRKHLLENAGGAFSYFTDIDGLVDKRILQISEQEVVNAFESRESWQTFIVGINKILKSNNSQLMVLDSITPLRPLAGDDRTFTRSINSMIENFRNLGITTIITMETPSTSFSEVSGLFGTFMFDGIVKLSTYNLEGSFQYLVSVIKMRRSNHRNVSMPYEITSKGFSVFK